MEARKQLGELKQLKNELIILRDKYHEKLSEYEKKLEEVNLQVETITEEQNEKEINLLNATKEWLDIKSKLELSVAPSKQRVKLNVGGLLYETTIETLTKFSDDTITYFKALFSKQWELEKDPKDDSIFIDRDGELFGYILQYLRTGIRPVDSTSELLQRDILIEAQFYQLDTLINLLKKEVPSDNFYSNSKILTLDNQKILNKISKHDGQKWQLIYCGSRDGFTGTSFHKYCDGCFPTMCVIRSKTGFIFGGFTSIPWSSAKEEKSDPLAFLFTLKNPYNLKAAKYPVRDISVGFSITHDPHNGPVFGSAPRGGADLYLKSPFNTSECRSIFPTHYHDTTGKGRLTFVGDSYFTCDEIEIFTLV